LSDESDIICPAAVLMAIGRGGRIVGVSHARGKESNRIETTINLLRCFGMDAEEREDGLEIPGYQSAIRPTEPVETFRDHRLAMTAMALASRYGGVVSEPEICAVSDPDFITRLLDLSD
jgi:3-phosphoshikimate 1-carboxyvinyltransferase